MSSLQVAIAACSRWPAPSAGLLLLVAALQRKQLQVLVQPWHSGADAFAPRRWWCPWGPGIDSTGLASIFVAHDQEEAMELAGLVVAMSMGWIEQVGKPENIRARPKTEAAKEFMSAWPGFLRRPRHQAGLTGKSCMS